ncbi:MAG: cytochrome c [Chromatiaceae bacterium]
MRTVTTLSVSACLLLAAGTAGNLFAQEKADGAQLFAKKTCVACHGKDAKSPILPIYPKLAGQNAQYAFNQMKDIKSGARNNGQTAAMKGVMHLVNEDEMRTIAEWLATLK